MGHQTTIRVGDEEVRTLADILPIEGPLRMLIVAKTPAWVSVEAGHYFQGRQGRMFWNRLREYDLLTAPPGTHEDDVLLAHGYGLTDVVKVPRDYGNEPSDDEYRNGLGRILGLIARLEPEVLMFVYKRVLDQILRLSFDRSKKSKYGFNPELDEMFGPRVFVFPMPGTPCTSAEAVVAMSGLTDLLAAEPGASPTIWSASSKDWMTTLGASIGTSAAITSATARSENTPMSELSIPARSSTYMPTVRCEQRSARRARSFRRR